MPTKDTDGLTICWFFSPVVPPDVAGVAVGDTLELAGSEGVVDETPSAFPVHPLCPPAVTDGHNAVASQLLMP